MPIRIVIAENHILLRQGIRNVLECEADFEVIGEAANGEEAVQQVMELAPDILLLDINMPKINGFDVIKKLSVQSAVRMVVLTIHDDESYVLEVIRSGASGYLLKEIAPEMLVKAIRTVYNGESYIYPTLIAKLLGELNTQKAKKYQVARIMECHREKRLTFREVEVLQLICQGLSNNEIAQRLYLSEKTVKNHLTNIFRKINVTDRTQAVIYAIKNKIVEI